MGGGGDFTVCSIQINSLFLCAEGELFAKCPVEGYPGIAVEGVLDSSRYFVLRIQDESGEKIVHLSSAE